jgi:2-amino-4-hydroxy-6-hydroxymethyldihydropteridine diphosphokinase
MAREWSIEVKSLDGKTLLGLGSNLGLTIAGRYHTPADIIVHSLTRLESAGLPVIAVSSLWTSPAWPPGRNGAPYSNAVALVDRGQASPETVLTTCLAIEAYLGRQRAPQDQWAARTLDIDVLDCNGIVRESATLTLPHPRIAQRAFVLGPLLEVMPDWVDPKTGQSARLLHQELCARNDAQGHDARAARSLGRMLKPVPTADEDRN